MVESRNVKDSEICATLGCTMMRPQPPMVSTVKETLIGAMQRNGYDTVTACEVVTQRLSELAPGTLTTLTLDNGERYRVARNVNGTGPNR